MVLDTFNIPVPCLQHFIQSFPYVKAEPESLKQLFEKLQSVMTSFMEQHLFLKGDNTCMHFYCASVSIHLLSNFSVYSSFITDTFNSAIFKEEIFIIIDLINFPEVFVHICFTKHFPFLPYTEFSSFN